MDDDAFIVPDDEEESDAHSLVLELNASDEELITTKPKKKQFKPKLKPKEPSPSTEEDEEPKEKTKTKARPSMTHATSSTSSGMGMLTAAEMRMMNQKEEKKQEEKPYEFLEDVKDVRDSSMGKLYTMANSVIFVNRRTESDPERKDMIRAHSTFPRVLGNHLLPSKCRHVASFWLRQAPDGLMAQFWEIKQNHYDTVCLCYRRGPIADLYP